MPVILKQQFPLGRFHATRWRQSVFEDPFGEWPPSPWRLLRALAARWIQYCRETGDDEIGKRDTLLKEMGSMCPSFLLPTHSWRPESVPRQYHRTALEWTAKGKKDAAYKKPMATLVYDRFQAIPPASSIYWLWDSLELTTEQRQLLYELTRRITYFGRAESHCQFRLVDELPSDVTPNCELVKERTASANPVLVPDPNEQLDLDSLLAATDAKGIAGMTAPPSAAWYYARLPERPKISYPRPMHNKHPKDIHLVQFAVGGRVYPTVRDWGRVTSWFRGRVLKNVATQFGKTSFVDLPDDLRIRFSGISGKDKNGKRLTGHQHAYFVLYPDEQGYPTRLVCYRPSPFLVEEIEAMYAASRRPFGWRKSHDAVPSSDDWQVQMVPLPLQTRSPIGFGGEAATGWVSATPFVPPGRRHRFRNGRLRPGETPEALAAKLIQKAGLPKCAVRVVVDEKRHWVSVHEPISERRQRQEETSRNVREGCYLQLKFEEPIPGPICLGHSSHFGLGLFVPCGDPHSSSRFLSPQYGNVHESMNAKMRSNNG